MSFKLRKFKPDDASELYEALKAPAVVKHMASEPFSLDDCRYIVNHTIEHWDTHGYGSWAVLQEDTVVGWAGFKFWQKDEVELLIVLGPEHWGLGAAIHSYLLKLAKEDFNLSELYILLPFTRKTYNTVIKRLGYTFCENVNFEGESFKKFKISL